MQQPIHRQKTMIRRERLDFVLIKKAANSLPDTSSVSLESDLSIRHAEGRHDLTRVRPPRVAVGGALVGNLVKDVVHVDLRGPGEVAPFPTVADKRAEHILAVGDLPRQHFNVAEGDRGPDSFSPLIALSRTATPVSPSGWLISMEYRWLPQSSKRTWALA